MKEKINKNTWEGNEAIRFASQVISELENINQFDLEHWVEYYDVNVMDFCAKPQKFTLLHAYIKDIYVFQIDYILDKHFPMEAINSLTRLLDFYDIDYSSVGEFEYVGLSDDELPISYELAEKYADKLWRFYQEKLMLVIINEIFTILYMNKTFLFEFNSQLSEIIGDLEASQYPTQLKKDGVFYRSSFPTWLKNGIRFRDRGRCQICGTDLTQIFQNDNAENYDHIIPLELHGTNDPTNIQLTCETCNKSKGARNMRHVNSFAAFWNI